MYKLRILTKENRLVVRKTKSSVKVLKRTHKKVNILANAKRGLQGEPGKIQELTAGPGIVIDSTNEANPVISASGGSGDKNFVYDFTMEHTLNVNHGLQKYPTATVINSAGDKVESTVQYIDINNVIIQFTQPFSGRVTLN